MHRITKELRHFESTFLEPAETSRAFPARVFDLAEELDALHRRLGPGAAQFLGAPPGSGGWRSPLGFLRTRLP
jgi:hypothetical protein